MRKAPNITETKLGRDIVDVLAFGCIQYMLDHTIPLTPEGFDQLVEESQRTGVKGRIAFQVYEWTQRRLQDLFKQMLPLGKLSSPERLRGRPSVRSRVLSLGLGTGDTSLTDEQKRCLIESIREYLGDDAVLILEAFREGDCQRRLVWQRIVEIQSEGDVRGALERFRDEAPSDSVR